MKYLIRHNGKEKIVTKPELKGLKDYKILKGISERPKMVKKDAIINR